jgi:hypothetical protein
VTCVDTLVWASKLQQKAIHKNLVGIESLAEAGVPYSALMQLRVCAALSVNQLLRAQPPSVTGAAAACSDALLIKTFLKILSFNASRLERPSSRSWPAAWPGERLPLSLWPQGGRVRRLCCRLRQAATRSFRHNMVRDDAVLAPCKQVGLPTTSEEPDLVVTFWWSRHLFFCFFLHFQ